MKKRGQLTIFIILGIVLLIAFGFLFFVRNLFFQAKVEAEAQTKLEEVFQSESFKTYTSSCLDEVSKDAILLIGKQGGNFYPSKYLPMQDNDKNISVSYGITWEPLNPDFLPPGAFTSLPEYPRLINIFQQSYFGNNNLPYLCQPEGPNQETQGDIKRETCTFLDPFVKPGYGPDSIQEQLSSYIAEKLDECINLSEIPGLGEVIVEQGNYDVEVIFGKEDVVINAIIPLVLYIEGETITQKAELSTNVDVRLKEVYELAHAIVEQDKKWLSFNKTSPDFTDQLETLGKLMPGFSIELSCPFCSYGDFVGYNYDDIIKITDSKSKIGKEPFVFMFAIENRIPVLEDISYFNPFNESPLITYDIIVGSDQKILIEPEGYDPDEDLLEYLYEGWREDYYTEFDLECCKGFGGNVDCRINYSKCVTKYESEITKPKDWTTSVEYKDTKKDASYTTELKDIGLHNVTVRAKDKENISDWGDLSILVVDTPAALGSGFNNYTGINISKASVEDPFYLNASASLSIILPLEDYSWYNLVDPFSFEHTTESILRLPYGIFNITNIKSKNFNTTALNGVTHTINLTVSNKIVTSDMASFSVSVYRCLPYDNPSGSYAPWPYNNLGISGFDSYNDIVDPFMADHTCCNEDYNYEDTNKECYRYEEYGTYEYFKNNPLTDEQIPGSSGIAQEEIGIPEDYGYQNDVYKRTFIRNCSGKRGNTCTGPVSIKITLIEECHNECERPGSFLNSNEEPVAGAISCEAMDIEHYIQIQGEGFITLDGTRCDDCGHLCEKEGYWFQPPCCVCLHGPTECDSGYTELGPTLEVIPPYSCTMCCVSKTEECEHDYS